MEDDARWHEVALLYEEHQPGTHFIRNIFSKREMELAQWLEDEYRERTYDLNDFCPSCGIGGVQKAPFRLRTEPRARRSQFIQLNWVFDELFVRTVVREGLMDAGITGIAFIVPVLHKHDQPSAQVAQMTILNVLPPGLETSSLNVVTCKQDNEELEGLLPVPIGHPEAIFLLRFKWYHI